MDYCYGGPSNFSIDVTPDDVASNTITYGTFNVWCGQQNPTPTGSTGLF